MSNELNKNRDKSPQSDWLECGTAEMMSREKRCHTERMKDGVEKKGSVEVRTPLWNWGCSRRKTPQDSEREESVNVWGGEMGIKMKMKSKFSYWAVALLLSRRPKISTTTPLLLHSGKKEINPVKKQLTVTLQQKFVLADTYFFKAHGTEFVYFACVLRTGNGSACIDVRPEPRCLFEHLWVLLVLCDEPMWKNNSRFMWKECSIPLPTT